MCPTVEDDRRFGLVVSVEYPSCAKLRLAEVGVLKLESWEDQALLTLSVLNVSSDRKLDLDFTKIRITDSAGNKYRVQEANGDRGLGKLQTSVPPGYVLRKPLILEKLVDHKDITVLFTSEFCADLEPVRVQVDHWMIDKVWTNFQKNPVTWDKPVRVYGADPEDVLVTFTKSAGATEVRVKVVGQNVGKSNAKFGPYYVYLYDKEGRLIDVGFENGTGPLLLIQKGIGHPEAFRIDWQHRAGAAAAGEGADKVRGG